MQLPEKLEKKIRLRLKENSLRTLKEEQKLIDFSSNDYLGFSDSEVIFRAAGEILAERNILQNGSGGSRLLTGNFALFQETEDVLAQFHNAGSALIFNSGYDANLGLFSTVPQKNDLVFFDELIHASIRDGIKLGPAQAFKFKHNDLEDLSEKVNRLKKKCPNADVYIVTESVFSMDGDSPDLTSFAEFATENNFFLIVDEAHATGVVGKQGEGMVQELGLEGQVFARILTFGKAIGCHGAAILGSPELKQFLINFARSFIYTTALPPHTVATILAAYEAFQKDVPIPEIQKLKENIEFFGLEIRRQSLDLFFIQSNSAIHTCILPGNEKVKNISEKLKSEGFDVRPILSPTVPKGKERLRICLHSHNSEEEITRLLQNLKNFL